MNSYKLTTIKDIFDKVPSDKINVCLDELKLAMNQANIIRLMHDSLGAEFNFPYSTEWIDDGKSTVTSNLINADTGDAVGTIKATIKK